MKSRNRQGYSGDRIFNSIPYFPCWPDNFDNFILNDMKKCPKPSCGCNYNIFNYPEYISACERLNYPQGEIFGRVNQRLLPRIRRIITDYFRT